MKRILHGGRSLVVNLWEAMTQRVSWAKKENMPWEVDKLEAALSHLGTQSPGYQELSLEPVEGGWLLRIFCVHSQHEYEEGDVEDDDWWIFVPRDGGRPVVSQRRDFNVVDLLASLDDQTGTEAP